MKKMLHTVAILLVSAALMAPTAEARGRNNSGSGAPQQQQQQQQSRPGNSGRGRQQSQPSSSRSTSGQQGTRTNGGGSSNSNRGTSGRNNGSSNRNNGSSNRNNGQQSSNNGSRPGNNGTRPGNSGRGHSNSGQGNGSSHGSASSRPNRGQQAANNRPANRHDHHHGGHCPQPSHHPHNDYHHHRPHAHPHCHYHHPAPPSHWHCPSYWRPFTTICGISFGSSVNVSINWLWNNGYTITSYGNDVIYLASVPMLGICWDDATLYYSRNALCGSSFISSTPYYDPCYYNQAYSRLVANYGNPYLVQNINGGIEATWWGSGNQYIRLSIVNAYANNGSLRYFTTLSFGI